MIFLPDLLWIDHGLQSRQEKGNVFGDREGRDEVEILEDHSDPLVAGIAWGIESEPADR